MAKKLTRARLKDLRANTLDLAEAQQRLRLLIGKISDSEGGLSVLELSRFLTGEDRADVAIRRIITNSSAVCSGDRFDAIFSGLVQHHEKLNMTADGVRALKHDISKANGELTPRLRGASLYSRQAIDAAFDLHDARVSIEESFSFDLFATAFVEDAELVGQVLDFHGKAFAALQDEAVRRRILAVTKQKNFARDLKQALDGRRAMLRELGDEFSDLFSRLRPKHKNNTAVAVALGVHSTTMNNVRNGVASEDSARQLIAAARRLLGLEEASGSDRDTAVATDSDGLIAAFLSKYGDKIQTIFGLDTDELRALLDHGGETSPLGVPLALTAKAFHAIPAIPGVEVVLLARHYLRLARGYTNMVAQLEDDAARERARMALEGEIREMHLALQMASFSLPGNLKELYDEQRLSWLGDGLGATKTPTKKKGGKR